MRREILDGQHFGEWEVIRYAGDRKQLCRCSCGTIQEVDTSSLKSGRSKHCNDKSKHILSGKKAFKDVTGQTFGDLYVVKYMGESKFLCRCTCGNEIIRLRKNLNSNSKCPECKNSTHRKYPKMMPTTETTRKSPKNFDDKTGKNIGDWFVEKYLGDCMWLCRCICGMTREIRSWDLNQDRMKNYKCNHKQIIGRQFGELKVIGRKPGGICICQCTCGNKKEIHIGNLLNGSTISCGCIRKPLYNKEEVLNTMIKFKETNRYKPFIYDLMQELNVGMTAAYSYVNEYGLREYMNSTFGSKAEQEIYSMFDNAELHTRKVISPQELDIYIPENKLAIEYNGSYWHSELNDKPKNYHQDKTIACAKKGIRLIHIFEHEWVKEENKNKIKNLLNSAVGKYTNRLYARELGVTKVDSKEAKDFLNENHLQCYVNSDINIALVDKNNNIMSIMTFGKPRFNNEYQYELLRYCNKLGASIVGGAEKLFSYFLKYYNPTSIITYTDISKFTGKVYTRLGFKTIQPNPITEPNYVWVSQDLKTVLTRYQTMKQKLISKGLGEEYQTEDEIMTSLNFMKIYNSGNLKLEYRKEYQGNENIW